MTRMRTGRRGSQRQHLLIPCSTLTLPLYAACAYVRARRQPPRRRRRGCALRRRRRRARPRLRARRLRRPRERRTQTPPCCRQGQCSGARSGGPGLRLPRQRTLPVAGGRRARGRWRSAGAKAAARRPHPSRAVLGAQRALRRRRSMPARTRCGPEWRLAADMPQRAQAARPSGRRRGVPTLQLFRRGCCQLGDSGVKRARAAEHPCDGQPAQCMVAWPCTTGEA